MFLFSSIAFQPDELLTCLPCRHIYDCVRTEWEHSSTPEDRDMALGKLLAAVVSPDIYLNSWHWLEIPLTGQWRGTQEDFVEN